MSKDEPLWGWVGKQPAKNFTLTFAEILLRETITVKLNITGKISLWKALKQLWTLLACGNNQVSVVFQKKRLTTETFLIIVKLTNVS